MPYFTPDYTVTINTVPDMGDKRDIPITLTGITQTDDYEGDFTTRQTLIYALSFTMKNYIYGPVRDSDIIRTVKARTYIETGSDDGFTDAAGKVIEQVVLPNPSDTDPDDTFTYNETTNFFEQPTVTYSDDKSSDPK